MIPSSKAGTDMVEVTQLRFLSFLHVGANKYDVSFPADASWTANVVLKNFPFWDSSINLLTAHDDKSVLCISKCTKSVGTNVKNIPLTKGLRPSKPLKIDMDARSDTQTQAWMFPLPAEFMLSAVEDPLIVINH